MKDASLILIFFALLAYINGHEYLFVFILLAFSIIYFTPQHYFDNYLSKFLGKKEKKNHPQAAHLQEPPQELTIETIETDIEIDDNITIDEQEDHEQDHDHDHDNDHEHDHEQEQDNQK